jgi:WhiB family redox-sensing transcriptional regulator
MTTGLRGLPGPVAELWDWQLQGACRQADPAKFFHPDSERSRARRHRVGNAKLVCARYPVMQRCRDHALAIPERYGVWGGMSEDERAARRQDVTPHRRREVRRRRDTVPRAG